MDQNIFTGEELFGQPSNSQNNQDLISGEDLFGGTTNVGNEQPRGIRNNNPGNIRKTDIDWQGEVPGQDNEFETFETPEHGVRALARNVGTYQKEHDVNSLRGLAGRWAPPTENNTDAYINSLSQSTGYGPDQALDFSDTEVMTNVSKGIIQHENGQALPDGVVERGIAMERGVPEVSQQPQPTPDTGQQVSGEELFDKPVVDPFEGEGFGPLFKRRGQQFVEGAVDTFASVPEGIAISGAIFDTSVKQQAPARIQELMGAVERVGGILQSGISPLNGKPLTPDEATNYEQRYANDLEAVQNWIELGQADVLPARDRPLFKAGDEFRDASREVFGKPDSRDDSFFGKVAGGAGNVVAYAGGSLVTGPVAPLTGAALGAAQNSSSTYKEAIEAGADEETAMQAAQIGGLIGTSEIIPIGRALKVLPQSVRSKFTSLFYRRLIKIGTGAGEEAAQEYLATVANNLVASGLYDPDRGWDEGAWESAAVGSILGGGMSTVGAARDNNKAPATADLKALMEDGRTVEDIKADEATAQAEQVKLAEVEAEAGKAAVQENNNLPDKGETVTVTTPTGETVTGTIEDFFSDSVEGETVEGFQIITEDGSREVIDMATVSSVGRGKATQEAPIEVETSEHVEVAAAQVETPSPAQAEAGNYKKGHLKLGGLNIAIETSKGSERTGVDGNGAPWSVTMPAHYGYVKKTEGADGDQVDVYIGHNPTSQNVWVVDQIDPQTGKFDEHKAMLGYDLQQEAIQTYHAGFSDGTGPSRVGAVTPMSFDGFKTWLNKSDNTQPISFKEQSPSPTNTDVAYKQLLNIVQNTKKPLHAARLAKEVGIEPAEATRLLDSMASFGNGLTKTAKGYKRNAVRTKPLDVLSFISQNGGIQDNENHQLKSSRDAQRFIPGAGNIVRNNGLDIDAMGEKLWQAGYFGNLASVQRPTTGEVLDLIETSLSGEGQYSEEDTNTVLEQQEIERNSDKTAQRDQIEMHVRAVGEENRFDFTDEEYQRIVNEVEKGASIEDALLDFAENQAFQPLPDSGQVLTDDILDQIFEPPHTRNREEVSRDNPNGERNNRVVAGRSERTEQTQEQHAGRSPDDGQQTERTDQGEQYIVQGAEQLSKNEVGHQRNRKAVRRQRLSENQKVRGENQPIEDISGGLFDSAKNQGDMFSEKTSASTELHLRVATPEQRQKLFSEINKSLDVGKSDATLLKGHNIADHEQDLREAGWTEDEKGFWFNKDKTGSLFFRSQGQDSSPIIQWQRTDDHPGPVSLDNHPFGRDIPHINTLKESRHNQETRAQIKQMRDWMWTFYKENIAGTSVEVEKLGKVIFDDGRKIKNSSANPYKIALIPKLPEIVRTSKYDEVVPHDTSKNDKKAAQSRNVKSWHRLTNNISIDGRVIPVTILVREDSSGNFHYNIGLIEEEIQLGANPEDKKRGLLKSDTPTPLAKRAEAPEEKASNQNIVSNEGKSNTVIVSSLSEVDAFNRRLLDGQVTPEEVKQGFESVIENKEALTAELSKLTKDQLLKKINSYSITKADKKDKLVKVAYDDFVSDFHLEDSISYNPFDKGGREKVIRSSVEKLTQGDIDAYAKKIAERREKYMAAQKKRAEGFKNPQTLEDFRLIISIKGLDGLTAEQRVKYDDLIGSTGREKLEQKRKEAAVVRGVELGNTEMDIVKTTHSVKGHDLYVVKLSDRVERDTYKELVSKAKKLGGYYSRYAKGDAIPGFQFKTMEDAERFVALKDGNVSTADKQEANREDKKSNTVERLQGMAEKMHSDADTSLNTDRRVNTARQSSMAASAEADAQTKKRIATSIQNIADGLAEGKVKHLQDIRTRADVETLDSILSSGKREEARAAQKADGDSYKKYEEIRNTPVTEKTVDFIRYPWPQLYHDFAADIARVGATLPGSKMAAVRLGKLVSKYERAGKSLVEFKTAQDIVDIRNLSEAVNKAKAGDNRSATREIDETHFKRLVRMGITNLPSLRAALREYLDYRGTTKKADPIKEAERALVGRKIDGFFPTPKTLIDRMREEADISSEHRVLEPSAGKGDIAQALKEDASNISVIEINSELRTLLEAKGFNPVATDFLGHNGTYDRIVMNPPFEKGQDIDHVKHAYDQLAPGGRVVAIMSEGPFYRQDKKASGFREWLDSVGGWSEENPAGSFKDAFRSTGVSTRLVVIDKQEIDINLPSLFQATYKPSIATKAEKLEREIVKELNRIAPNVQRVEIQDGLLQVGGKPATGNYSLAKDIIRVALTEEVDPRWSARHEVIHHLVHTGRLTNAEWDVLKDQAQTVWRGKYQTDIYYGSFYSRFDKETSEHFLNEEAVADAYAHWKTNKLNVPKSVEKIFQKIRRIWNAIRTYLNGNDYHSWNDVFENIDQGNLGNRRSPLTQVIGQKGFEKEAASFFGKDADVPALFKKSQEDIKTIIQHYSGTDSFLTANTKENRDIEIVERQDSQDLNVLKRWLYTPASAFKKWPALQQLQKQGVKSEIEMSKFVRRLSGDYDTIRSKLSSTEFDELSEVLFLGDSNQQEFTSAELKEMSISDKVVDAYAATRTLFEKLGRFVDQHRRAMVPSLRKQKLALIIKMSRYSDLSRPQFQALFDKRSRLKRKLRLGEGEITKLQAEIDTIETKLGFNGKKSELFEAPLEEADKVDAALTQTSVRTRKGYVPHKFFGSWAVYEKITVDGEIQHKLVAGESGFHPDKDSAISTAKVFLAEKPKADLVVQPVQFQFPNSEATALTDASYWRFMKSIGDQFAIEGQELQDIVHGVARRKYRRRQASFAQFRQGTKGYSQDFDKVMMAHIGETVRYVMLDRLKYDAINTMEDMGLSPNRTANQQQQVLQDAVHSWLRDMNGQKQPVESQVDELFSKPWATPLRVALASGSSVAALTTFGISANPIIGSLLGSYIGYRFYAALKDGGEFKTRAITGAMLGDMAHLKLGSFFNVFSAMVNLTQTAINTLPVMGGDTLRGFKRLEEAMRSRIAGKPNRYWRLLERADVVTQFKYSEVGAKQFKRESWLPKASLYLFDSAERFNRAVSFLAGYEKARRAGSTEGEAFRAGEKAMVQTQHHYGNANKPEVLRSTIGRVPLQFKNYMFQQIAFVANLKSKKEVAVFLLAMFLMAGSLGIPGADLLDKLLEALFDYSPIEEIKKMALQMQAEGELSASIGNILSRGLPSLLSEDISARVGMGDKFLPTEARDFQGPWATTIDSAVRLGELNATVADQLRNLSTGLGRPLKSLEAYANGMPLETGIMRPVDFYEALKDDRIAYTNPWFGGALEYDERQLSESDLIRMAVGSTPMHVAQGRDLNQIAKRAAEKEQAKKEKIINALTEAYRERMLGGNVEVVKADLKKIFQEAKDKDIKITKQQIRVVIDKVTTPRIMRNVKRSRKSVRQELFGYAKAVAPDVFGQPTSKN